MTPRAKGRIWRYATLLIMTLLGAGLFLVLLDGPWHEMILWGFVSAWFARNVGAAVEAFEHGRRRREIARRFEAEAQAAIETLEARLRERGLL